MRLFAIVFALTLVLVPISFKVRAEDVATSTATSTPFDASSTEIIIPTSTPEVASTTPEIKESKNPIVVLRKMLMKRLEEREVEIQAEKVVPIKSRFSIFQRKFEEILRRLNNTDS